MRKLSETCEFLKFLVLVIIVLSVVSFVIWLSTRPRNPKFTITDIYIPKTPSQNQSKNQQNQTSVAFLLEVTNPNNGMTVCYNDIVMELHYGDVLVGKTPVGEAFCQGHKKTVSREVVFDVDGQLWRRIMGGGELRVAVETMFKYRIFKWKRKIRHMGFEGFVRIGARWNMFVPVHLHKTS